jgi:hypothetical protein
MFESSRMVQTPTIDIRLSDSQKTYTTSENIYGMAIVETYVDTPFDHVEIHFLGVSKITIERWASMAAINTSSVSAHAFLTLRQPDLEVRYPSDRILRKGNTYEFPFMFVVPAHLVEGACSHLVAHQNVRDAHLLLPPTLGDQGLPQNGKPVDDLSPEMANIRYGVSASIFNVSPHDPETKRAKIATSWCSLRVIPKMNELPPLVIEDLARQGSRIDQFLRNERKIRRGIFGHRLGTLVMEALQPKCLKLQHRADSACHGKPTTIAYVMLRFDPDDDVTTAPRLVKITSKLEINTFFAAAKRQEFPSKHDGEFDANRGVYSKSIALASRTLKSSLWHAIDSDNSSRFVMQAQGSTINHRWVPMPGRDQVAGHLSRTATVLVPVELPTMKDLVPTFHSCLVSRMYTLGLSLTYLDCGFNRSIDLRVPLQISADLSD